MDNSELNHETAADGPRFTTGQAILLVTLVVLNLLLLTLLILALSGNLSL